MDLEQLKKDTKEILVDVLEKSRLRQGQILVLGMSSSEVAKEGPRDRQCPSESPCRRGWTTRSFQVF